MVAKRTMLKPRRLGKGVMDKIKNFLKNNQVISRSANYASKNVGKYLSPEKAMVAQSLLNQVEKSAAQRGYGKRKAPRKPRRRMGGNLLTKARDFLKRNQVLSRAGTALMEFVPAPYQPLASLAISKLQEKGYGKKRNIRRMMGRGVLPPSPYNTTTPALGVIKY
jgi:hypothetical protein